MSKANLRRFKNARISLNDKEQTWQYVRDELPNIVSEIDDALKGITFSENFAGKVVSVDIEAMQQFETVNPLDKVPSDFMVLGSNVPGIIRGARFDREKLSFTSVHGRDVIVGTTISFNTGTDEVQLSSPNLPVFLPGMAVVFRSMGGTLPGGIVAGRRYWVKALGGAAPSNFTLSESPGGVTLDITSAGSGNLRIAAAGTVKILLLR